MSSIGSIERPSVTIIIPTWNEADNISVLYEKISAAMSTYDWKIIVVDDDSEDLSWQLADEIGESDPRVSVIRRIGRKGLTSACIEGFVASDTDYCAVIDADLQHDEGLLPKMLQTFIESPDTDLVVGSRKMADASFGQMPKHRVIASEFARKLTKLAIRIPLSDPLSGFFMIKRSSFLAVKKKLFGRGFKILLDICAASEPSLKIAELPYSMRSRHAGESKLKWQVMFEFVAFLIYQFFGQRFALPPKFIKFCVVGLSGVVVHMSVLAVTHKLLLWSFLSSQILATIVAMISNFVINNNFTFREQKLTGLAFYKGALSFAVICSVGSLIGISVSTFLNDRGTVWWLAGFVSIALSAIWNFCVNNVFTWRNREQA